MPFVVLLLLAILVGMFGFWDALEAILGAVGILLFAIVVAGVLAVVIGWVAFKKREREP